MAAALLCALALLVGACSSGAATSAGKASSTTAQASATPVEVAARDDIHGYARPLAPGDPGEVIAVQQVDGVDVAGTVLRVLYHSRSVGGDDIAVSGLIVVPRGTAPPGGRAPGSHGRAEER